MLTFCGVGMLLSSLRLAYLVWRRVLTLAAAAPKAGSWAGAADSWADGGLGDSWSDAADLAGEAARLLPALRWAGRARGAAAGLFLAQSAQLGLLALRAASLLAQAAPLGRLGLQSSLGRG